MEKVQFQLESTLPELKDFYDKGLFSKNEIDQITRRRTALETSLVRRHTRKEDFFKYAEYEINLERLRKVRWKKLGYHINPPPPSASSYSLPRRAIYILKRATVKFPGDLAVWLAYVEYASTEGMRKIVAKGLTLALQHHPLSPTLYLLLSYHHLHPNSPFPREVIPSASTLDLPSTSKTRDTGFSLEGTSAARTQLLLGLRLIPDSTTLWMEYIKLELGWVEALRRRWNVLGINDTMDQPDSNEVDAERMTGGEGSFGPDGEDARKAILSGQLVIHAIKSALEAIDGEKGMVFRLSLIRLLRRYPSALRGKALDGVFADLGRIADGEDKNLAAEAKLAALTRGLYETKYVPGEIDKALDGVELVEELGRIGKEIRKSAKEGSAFLRVAGEWLVQQIKEQRDKDDLRNYLLSILTSLTSAKLNSPPTLLTRHLYLLRSLDTDQNLLKISRTHAVQHPSDAPLQLFRIQQEVKYGDPTNLFEIFEKTVQRVSPKEAGNEESDVRKIWFTWTSTEEYNHEVAGTDIDGVWSSILTLSAKVNRPETHSALLGRYFISTQQRQMPLSPLPLIESFAKYRPSDDFFAIAFITISTYSSNAFRDISKLYEHRRGSARTKQGRIDAALDWAEWLIRHKKAFEAVKIVDSVKRDDEVEVERRWKLICDAVETADGSKGDSISQLETKLAEKGWPGLSTFDGVVREVDEEDSDSDEEMEDESAENESESEGDEDMEAA